MKTRAMASRKDKTAHVRRQKSVASVEAREQPAAHASDVTGFHRGGGCVEDPEGESQRLERREEEAVEGRELAALSDHFEGGDAQQSRIEDGSGAERESTEIHDMTPYVASCAAHVESLRKRKREQEERVEVLVQESFGHVESIMNFLMASLQQSHAASRTEFDAIDARIAQSLDKHNQIEKKMKMIAAILMHGQDERVQDE